MIQHPIPQNVTGYQFRLIGDMTIKQFVFLSIGVGAAIAFYYTNLFFFIKWFFIILSAAGGFAVAFLPLEERPLDQWIINYFRAIYRPTFFIWHKNPQVPEYLSYVPSVKPNVAADSEEVSRLVAIRRQQGLHSFLTTLPSDRHGDLDLRENAATQNLISLFGLSSTTSPAVPEVAATNYNISPATTPPLPVNNLPTSLKTPVSSSKPQSPNSGIIDSSPIKIKTTPTTDSDPNLSRNQPSLNQNQPTSSVMSADTSTPTVAATTSTSLPFPSAPTTPNTIVGMVLDQNQKIVPGAIIEVLDTTGLPVRATKTNQLGQFFSTTPLKRGTYHLSVDKDNLTFDTIELKLDGQIVNPLKIQALSTKH